MVQFFLLISLLVVLPVYAEEPLTPVPDPPDLPPQITSGEPMEPDITIIRYHEETIEEYRVNNRVRMVKIKPVFGPVYYLLDTDGDGNMDIRRSDNEAGMKINQWVLFSW